MKIKEDAATPRLREAFTRAERDGRVLAVKVRTLAFALIALWLLIGVPSVTILHPLGLIVLFMILGVMPLALARIGFSQWWIAYVFVALDSALLVFTLFFPNPLVAEHFPLPVYLRFDWFVYFFVLLAFNALSYSPLLVLWSGITGAAAWSVGMWWLTARTETLPFRPLTSSSSVSIDERLAAILDPAYVNIDKWEQSVVVLTLVAIILAAAVWRARKLVEIQVDAERARTNLARYFSPNIVERLTESEARLADVSRQKAAVLFADIVGFTALSEGLEPERVVELLRGFHSRMATTVFSYDGTVDKFIGDAVMATFGTPRPSPDDAGRALRCAVTMADEIERWNQKRIARGAFPIQVGIGLHYGEVVVGNIGDDRQLEYTVIGDTVNVASRLEKLTRELGSAIVVSDDVIEAARSEATGNERVLARFTRHDGQSVIRGRHAAVPVWTFDKEVKAIAS